MPSNPSRITRRSALAGLGWSLAGMQFAGAPLFGAEGRAAPGPQLHHRPRAKRVIFLFMHGGPSHVDTFDYKPRLQANDGGDFPLELPPNIDAKPKLMASPWKFAQRGESGLWVSDLLPHTATCADELCVVRSVHSRGQSHGQAVSMLHTGSDNLLRPSVGAWVSYALGSGNPALPAFVSISPASGHGGPRNYGAAFLPASHQATTIGRSGSLGDGVIPFLANDAIDSDAQRRQLALLQAINHDHLEAAERDAGLSGAINAFDLAARMQSVAPDVLDLSREPKHVLDAYGVGREPTDEFGRQCVLARRLAEAGVTYIEVSTGNIWDQHSDLVGGHTKNAAKTDLPTAALLRDLKARGMLDDTLVVWGGEFGRTPVLQGGNGRDHNPQGFTMWLAGGGFRGGHAHGSTDEFGYYAVQDRVHMHDLHATILYALGVDHERLTYRYAGRDFRLTDVFGTVVHEIMG